MKNDVSNREDVALLVRLFYDKVRVDETLGPIFNPIISDWETHLKHITDFWYMNVFGGKSYVGNPITAHQEVDDKSGNNIEAFHFGTWIELWFSTIGENFEGDNADLLKRRARKMQTGLLVAIYQHRQKN